MRWQNQERELVQLLPEVLFRTNLVPLRCTIFLFYNGIVVELIGVDSGLDELNAVLNATVEEVKSDIRKAQVAVGPAVGFEDCDVEAIVEGEGFEGGEEHLKEGAIEPEGGFGFGLEEGLQEVVLDEFAGVFLGTNFDGAFAEGEFKSIKTFFFFQNGLLVHFDQVVEGEGLFDAGEIGFEAVELKRVNEEVVVAVFLDHFEDRVVLVLVLAVEHVLHLHDYC